MNRDRINVPSEMPEAKASFQQLCSWGLSPTLPPKLSALFPTDFNYLAICFLPGTEHPHRRFNPSKLKKKLPKQTSVPNIRHIIAGSVCRIICTGGNGP